MPRAKPRGGLERTAAADLFKHTLSRIPTMYGQLSYLASLRDVNSGTYKHHGLFQRFGREESLDALQASHEDLFVDWLSLSLAEKTRDLEVYIDSLEDPGASVIRHWKRSRVYRTYVPEMATPAQAADFLSDLEILLEMMP